MQNHVRNQYMKSAVTTADRGKLIVLLYEGALNFLIKAKHSIEQGDIPEKCNNINRTQDIIQELNCSLNMEEGGEIARDLRNLYLFMERHLVRAKIERDGTEKIDEVMSMLSSLYEAWSEILKRPEVVQHIRQVDQSMSQGLSQGITI